MRSGIQGLLLFAGVLSMASPGARAGEIDLAEWALNVDGIIYDMFSGPLPASVDSSAFSFLTGIGTLRTRVSGIGPHFVGWYLDHEIDQTDNLWYNETGAAMGTPAGGQTWEIDEPGYGMDGDLGPYVGDILYDNFNVSDAGASLLDGLVFESYGRCDPTRGGDPNYCDDAADYFFDSQRLPLTDFKASGRDDVSMAMGWNLLLGVDELADIWITVGETVPNSGFYLTQNDPDSGTTIYMQGTAKIAKVPLPGTALLMLGALCAVGWRQHRASQSLVLLSRIIPTSAQPERMI